MERIKKALERAREQRTTLQPDSPLKTMRNAVAPQLEPVQSDPASADATQTFTETQAAPEPVSLTPDTQAEQAAKVLQSDDTQTLQEPKSGQSAEQESAGENRIEADNTKPVDKLPNRPVLHRKSAMPSEIEYSQTRRVEISADRLESNRIVAGIKDHPQSDLFRVLRTKVLHRMRVDKINSLAVTSPTKGAGKSMIAANLAVSLAMEANQTVMLVDLDLRRPAISRYFGFNAQQGVSDYLLEGTDLPELLIQPGIDRLIILPAGNPVPQSSELLSTPRMTHLVEDVTNRYATRIVVFDLPPLLHLDDALIFLPQVKSSLLVVEEGVNTPAEIEQSLMLLEKSNMLGTVYNKARHTRNQPY